MKSIYSNLWIETVGKIASYRCAAVISMALLCFSSPLQNTTASAQTGNNTNLELLGVAAISDAVSTLIRVLQSENIEARVNAARALGGMGIQAKIAKPALKVALYDKEPRVRYSAATALVNLGGDTKTAFPHLLEALQSESKWIRNDAAYAASNLALNLLSKASELSDGELNRAISDFEKTLEVMEKSKFEIPSQAVKSIDDSLDYLQRERQRG
ncbi:MAG: HEAT repeat domain-containing protein [Cyanobacteria bacterium P01_D01_bin.50]